MEVKSHRRKEGSRRKSKSRSGVGVKGGRGGEGDVGRVGGG